MTRPARASAGATRTPASSSPRSRVDARPTARRSGGHAPRLDSRSRAEARGTRVASDLPAGQVHSPRELRANRVPGTPSALPGAHLPHCNRSSTAPPEHSAIVRTGRPFISRRAHMPRKALLALIVAALSAVAIGGISAAAGTTTKTQPHGHGLLGTWQATIVPPAPQPAVHSLQVYLPGGGWVETSDQDPRGR